jgi:hexosaminidase
MRIILSLLSFLLPSLFCFSQEIAIIPQPVSLQSKPGKFTLTKKTAIVATDAQDRKTAALLNEYLQQFYGFKLNITKQASKNFIRFSTRKFIKAPDKDAYIMDVTTNGVSIEGDTYEGTFYGMQTLIQLLPTTKISGSQYPIPYVTINDYPRFAYRGMHLDVGRHFFPVSFVKKYIDYLALHKMNYFHWHLTEDQGWRIEIKKYPKLTEVGAYRNGTIIGRYPGTDNDNIRDGGFYTQEEIKDIVRYAADRHITVVPEIEMPGHSSAAIAAYPWLSCFPNEETKILTHPSLASQQNHGKKVQETWGVFEDVYCAGKDSTFLFLQDVMDEVLALFPSQYIHVGGDECPKSNWKRCPQCQARIKQEGLKDEHQLQSYFIQRMEKYLNSKGRILIGWDEILEGGLAPNAWVMSWRGEEGGIEAAKQNHNVIMTPGNYVYLDHSQTKNEDSVVIGGYTPIEKVYDYEPVPKELNEEQAKFIKGAQGNVWTEYMKYPRKVEYMIFPRMSALSEALWSPKEKKDWKDFETRLPSQFKRYELWKANYSKAYYELKASVLPTKDFKGLLWKLETTLKGSNVTYGEKKNAPYSKYINPIKIDTSKTLYASLLKENKPFSELTQTFYFNKATGKRASITRAPSEKYPGQGAFSLVNGIYSNKGLSYADWLGWVGDDMEAIIDLGYDTDFSTVKMHTIEQNGSWIYVPQSVEVLISSDGKNFSSAGKSTEFVKDTLTMGWMNVSFPRQSARFIKVIAKNYGMIPDGKPGAGNKAWLFADEIQVN